ncbi:Uncharacterised protein [Pseudomonas fluorescens]|uniref:Uncharacterized protein n=1 Tax=Pseudomonas fluorescens TaxID=294 RepID=A0A3S4PVL5_PSEFL|nr:Uncharacterised protein [Pseudomonas fluorescens]
MCVLGILDWGHIRFIGCGRWRFRSYSESLFQTPKRNQKALPLAYGTSLRLSVPSLRCPSGGIAYGLLRCTSSRCMRLRRTVAALPPLTNTYARPADGTEDQKPQPDQRPDQRPDQKIAACGSSYSWIGYNLKKQVGCQAAFVGSPLGAGSFHTKAKQRSCPRRSRPTQQ